MDTRYSHPPDSNHEGVLLLDHLQDVADRVKYIVDTDATTPDGESLRAVVETLAYVHDFGKATTYFQQHLLDEPRQYDDERCRHHAPAGSFAAYYALDARGFATETCLAGFVAVAKHHGQLPDVAEYIQNRTHRRDNPSEENSSERQQAIIAKQLKNINDNAPELAERVLENASAGEGDWLSFAGNFLELLDDIANEVETAGKNPGIDRDALSTECYGLVLQCWSALVLADKTSAADAKNSPKTYASTIPSMSDLDEYVSELEAEANPDPDGTKPQRLDHYRSRARDAVLNNVEEFAESGSGVATLTLPTGMGKTLSGLSAAFELRDRLGGERVVYALPFTSVIDQVVDELKEVYETDTTGRLLTADHHLADTVIYDDEDDTADKADADDDIAGMLGESWRGGLTVSTFVQLFESLAGPRNQQSMKLPALQNSVIVLDEPQSLPLDWWKLVPRLVDLLVEQYGATVIAMTATQPKLFDSVPELVDDPSVYFGDIERVSYELDESTERYITDQNDGSPKSYGDAAAALCEVVEAGTSALAVCNTVDSSRTLTEKVIETGPDLLKIAEIYDDKLGTTERSDIVDAVVRAVKDNGRPAVMHLSTRLRPTDRLALIEAAKELTDDGYPLVVVSTQLVEAGVDISFDRVYRDLAPIDSIVQAAGRCNRSFERDHGRVTVWWLDVPADQEKTPAEAVYNRGVSLLPVATETLASVRSDDSKLSEEAVARTAVQRYYDRLHSEKDVGKDSYVNYVDAAKADELANLSLIDQRRAVDIIVCRTERDRDIVEDIRKAAESYDFDTFQQRLDQTKSIRISAPVYRDDSEAAEAIGNLPRLLTGDIFKHATGIRVLDIREHGNHFDTTEGFIIPDNSVDHLFL